MKQVYSTYHNQAGTCTQEDWDDARTGRNPSGQVRVQFATFSQAVPKCYLQENITEPNGPSPICELG